MSKLLAKIQNESGERYASQKDEILALHRLFVKSAKESAISKEVLI
ncbi:MAG: hypothetical protein SFT91_05840 [Rickettsiaceae bacterium]|nr:hypothetical protein [Rickettsiaceae bacterium]